MYDVIQPRTAGVAGIDSENAEVMRQLPPTKRAISGSLAIRCCRVTVELLVRPTSATRPIVCGKLDSPICLPVLKEYSGDVAFAAFVAKSPTLQ